MSKHQTLASVCSFLEEDNLLGAADLLRREYPFTAAETVERKYGDHEALKVFLRDGFVDRYSVLTTPEQWVDVLDGQAATPDDIVAAVAVFEEYVAAARR